MNLMVVSMTEFEVLLGQEFFMKATASVTPDAKNFMNDK